MIFDLLSKYIFNLDTFHRLFFFLGTPAGESLKRFIELVFFLIIVYMLVSEFKKHKKREYKYLIVGFFSLFFRQFVMSLILFSQVFGINKFDRFELVISHLDNYLELVALILLVSAFMFPAFKEVTKKFQSNILAALGLVSVITLFDYLLIKNSFISENTNLMIFLIMKILILMTPFFLIHLGKWERIKYLNSILLAFFIYALTPLLYLVNLSLIGYINQRVIVSQHPLPFIAILLLMRSVYLQLVDKAFLQTRLKKTEAEVKHEKELSRLKDYFVSVVSHELKTPVTSMKLYLSLLHNKRFGDITAKQKQAIQTVINENNRLADLINDLLTVNKIEAGKIKLNIEEFDLNEILDQLYFNLAKDKGIHIINRVPPNFLVKGDKLRLKQVFVNLLNNAIKFSGAGSTIEINCDRDSYHWSFSIKDSGIGIPKDELPKLFDKFFQVEKTMARKSQGIGLGLSIVKQLVDLHGGRVDVSSELNQGTTFTVRIPYSSV